MALSGRPDSGAGLVLYRQFPGTRKYFAYLPEGPVADWSDPHIDRWLTPLMRHLRSAGAFAVRIGPTPAYRRWDAATVKAASGPGRQISDVLATEVDPVGAALADRLRTRGWTRCGGEDDGDAQPRHVFRVPLAGRTLDEVWAGLNQEWRRNVRKATKSGVETVIGTSADLPEFYRLLRITEERDGFGSAAPSRTTSSSTRSSTRRRPAACGSTWASTRARSSPPTR